MTDPQALPAMPDAPEDMPAPVGAAAPEIPAPPVDAAAPDYLPPKFWDAEAGQIRVEDLARSYAALERRLGAAGGDTVPEDPAGYRIEPAMEGLTADPEINARLMEAGFTQAQAQLVYDLAAEKLAPLVRDLAAETVQGEHRCRQVGLTPGIDLRRPLADGRGADRCLGSGQPAGTGVRGAV